MRILFIAIISWSLLTALSNATPERYASGIPSLDAFLKVKPANQIVVGITGFYGQDQPQQWLVLAKDPNSEDYLHEYVISDGEIKGSRKMRNLPFQDIPDVPINRGRLRVDSDLAFELAEELALDAKMAYDSVHYQLRCRDQNHEPVWMVNMLDPAGRSVGIHYISAETGIILRSVWHRSDRQSMSSSRGTDGKPVNLLYGASVREITVSGKAAPKKREVIRVITPSGVYQSANK